MIEPKKLNMISPIRKPTLAYARFGLMVVAVSGEPSFTATRPELLFQGSYALDEPEVGFANYDVAPEGDRFVMVDSANDEDDVTLPTLTVVANWFEELTERVPVN